MRRGRRQLMRTQTDRSALRARICLRGLPQLATVAEMPPRRLHLERVGAPRIQRAGPGLDPREEGTDEPRVLPAWLDKAPEPLERKRTRRGRQLRDRGGQEFR